MFNCVYIHKHRRFIFLLFIQTSQINSLMKKNHQYTEYMSGTSSQKYRSKRKQLRKLGNQNLRRNATSPSISSDFQQNKIRYISFSSLNKKLKRIQITYKKKKKENYPYNLDINWEIRIMNRSI